MEVSAKDRQARSRSAWFAYFIGLTFLFFAGVTAGVWVSIQMGRIQGSRVEASAREIGEGENLSFLRVPGAVLYLAAAALTGRPVRARVGASTVIQAQAVNKDDYRLQINREITDFGLAIGSGYDSIDRRRSLTIRQSLNPKWAIGVDRTISNIEDQAESIIHVQFVTPF